MTYYPEQEMMDDLADFRKQVAAMNDVAFVASVQAVFAGAERWKKVVQLSAWHEFVLLQIQLRSLVKYISP